jgi:hypothetical protein
MGPDGKAHPFIEKRRVTKKYVSPEGQGGGDFIEEVAPTLSFRENRRSSVMSFGGSSLKGVFVSL